MAQQTQKKTVEAAEESGMNPAVLASAASVLLSWYLFFIQDDQLRGVFVGLWPPTFLAFASYFEQARIRNKMEHVTGSRLMDRIESMMQTQ